MAKKLCVDCKWCVNPGEFAECRAPKNFSDDATGFGLRPKLKYCEAQRLLVFPRWFQIPLEIFSTDCGYLGRWWEPKP